MVSLIPGTRLMSRLRRRSSRSLGSQHEIDIPSSNQDDSSLDNALQLDNALAADENNNQGATSKESNDESSCCSSSCHAKSSKCDSKEGKSREEDEENERVENGSIQHASSIASLDEAIEKRRLKSVKSASGMSQQDLRATIRDVQNDPHLSQEEKTKKIQEIMSFSWRKAQEKANENTASARRKRRINSCKSLRRLNSTGDMEGASSTSLANQRTQSVYVGTLSTTASATGSSLSGIDAVSVGDDDDTDADNDSEHEVDEDIVQYHDEDLEIFGCKHYERKCMISAPCCDEFYCCRFCHDEEEDHEINRQAINRCRCMFCGHVQGIQKTCEKCHKDFARYFCGSCNFFDDKEGKHIYHCDKCNICRIGEGLGVDYFHCDRCNACMSITLKDHKCVERSLESDCPVCSEYLFTSTTPVMFLPCGHCIHVKCYENYTATNYTCPICGKSLGDMQAYFRRIDEMLASEQMPEEYVGLRSRIFCADCEVRSIAPFHFVYHKCQDCGSYNTKVLEQLPREESTSASASASASAHRPPGNYAAPTLSSSRRAVRATTITTSTANNNGSAGSITNRPPRQDSRSRRTELTRTLSGRRRPANTQ